MFQSARVKSSIDSFNGFAIALAWPETRCKRAESWYDIPMHYIGISKEGYYRVGHAAILLIDDETRKCRYFDFGRYHSPFGYGRVRSEETDHDLAVNTHAICNDNSCNIDNLSEILHELFLNPSTHGSGTICGTVTRINFDNAIALTKQFQKIEFIPYGPFVQNGTNCSRFVNSVLLAGKPALLTRIGLRFPLTISSTPMWNLRAIGGRIRRVGRSKENEMELAIDPLLNGFFSEKKLTVKEFRFIM